MIIIIGLKDFKKNAKKLVKKQDYILLNATGDSDNLIDYSNISEIDAFAADKKVYSKPDDDLLDFHFDNDNLKTAQKRFFKSKNFRLGVASLCDAIIKNNGNINIFIILKQKAYKGFSSKSSNKMVKAINTYLDDIDITYSFDDVEEDKKILEKSIKKKDISKLKNILIDLQKEPKRKKK